jgi:hypothetical protein
MSKRKFIKLVKTEGVDVKEEITLERRTFWGITYFEDFSYYENEMTKQKTGFK